eukprot:616666_1
MNEMQPKSITLNECMCYVLPNEIEEAEEYFELESFCNVMHFGYYVNTERNADVPIYKKYKSYDERESVLKMGFEFTLQHEVEQTNKAKTASPPSRDDVSSVLLDDTNEFINRVGCVFMMVSNDHIEDVKKILNAWQTKHGKW